MNVALSFCKNLSSISFLSRCFFSEKKAEAGLLFVFGMYTQNQCQEPSTSNCKITSTDFRMHNIHWKWFLCFSKAGPISNIKTISNIEHELCLNAFLSEKKKLKQRYTCKNKSQISCSAERKLYKAFHLYEYQCVSIHSYLYT